MDNFTKSANQLWKESNTTLSFKDWLEREKNKGKFIPNKKFLGINGIDTTQVDRVLDEANQKAVDSLGLNSTKFEDALGMTKKNIINRDNNKFIGLNKWLLISSLVVIGGAIAYKIYNKKK
jgi:phage anti-repressor protein